MLKFLPNSAVTCPYRGVKGLQDATAALLYRCQRETVCRAQWRGKVKSRQGTSSGSAPDRMLCSLLSRSPHPAPASAGLESRLARLQVGTTNT